jgi:hypothetical protein
MGQVTEDVVDLSVLGDAMRTFDDPVKEYPVLPDLWNPQNKRTFFESSQKQLMASQKKYNRLTTKITSAQMSVISTQKRIHGNKVKQGILSLE